ncbi:MAG: MGMT family protein [Candidatus Heimdallarchaeota archaeon]|nr:MGMT family protein [Candidatus Heimdallarchaeota archaeon]
MNQLKFILTKDQGHYVAVVESSIGIVANTVPSKNKEIHLNFLHKIKSKLNIENILISNSKSMYTDILFELNKAPNMSWPISKDLPIDFLLYTKKQQIVAEQLRKIPPGDIVSYGILAELSGIARGARFVGNCMATNFVPLLIPCHRVIKSDNSLGNYSAGGPEVKYRLLKLEGVNLD